MSVQTYLNTLASQLVLSDDERASITRSINTLRNRLNDYFNGTIQAQLQFGSSTRGTILPRQADPSSDVDYMVVFVDGVSVQPQTLITRLKNFAIAKYNTSEIFQSHPTIVLSLNHINFELVPAHKDWFGVLNIPGPSSGFTAWITTAPNSFNAELVAKNESNGSLIKPMIRLMKYWNAANGYVYDSYSLEKALVNEWYWSCSTLRDYFFRAIESRSTGSLYVQWRRDKLQRAKDIVARTKSLEASGRHAEAEYEISKLLPSY